MNVINLTDSVFKFSKVIRDRGGLYSTMYYFTYPGNGICSKTFPEEAAKLRELNSQRIDDVNTLLPEEME